MFHLISDGLARAGRMSWQTDFSLMRGSAGGFSSWDGTALPAFELEARRSPIDGSFLSSSAWKYYQCLSLHQCLLSVVGLLGAPLLLCVQLCEFACACS